MNKFHTLPAIFFQSRLFAHDTFHVVKIYRMFAIGLEHVKFDVCIENELLPFTSMVEVE